MIVKSIVMYYSNVYCNIFSPSNRVHEIHPCTHEYCLFLDKNNAKLTSLPGTQGEMIDKNWEII